MTSFAMWGETWKDITADGVWDVYTCLFVCSKRLEFFLLKGEDGGFGGRRASVHKSITRGNTDQTMKNISCLCKDTQHKSKEKRNKLTTWWILIGFESAAFPKTFSSSMSLTQRYSEGREEGRPESLWAYVRLEELDTIPASSGWMCPEPKCKWSQKWFNTEGGTISESGNQGGITKENVIITSLDTSRRTRSLD